jgi:hypothetical protein
MIFEGGQGIILAGFTVASRKRLESNKLCGMIEKTRISFSIYGDFHTPAKRIS